MILAGDIGGTNTRLGLFDHDGQRPSLVREETFSSAGYPHLEDIAAEFLEKIEEGVDRACFGIAGPVIDNHCEATNLAWTVDGRQMEKELGLKRVELINDLVANAFGTLVLESGDMLVLHAGDPKAAGNQAIISPGTGLGEGGLFFDGSRHHPFPSEGGHTDFAPRNDQETELLKYLAEKYGHVSYERILSGPGLYNIHRFLRDTGRHKEPDRLAEEMASSDPAEVIGKAAFSEHIPICTHTVEMFLQILGAEAGNLALKVLALGGVWVGGGIMASWLEGGFENYPSHLPGAEVFKSAFTDKGRFRGLLEKIPVRVILNDKTALLGAAQCAFGLDG